MLSIILVSIWSFIWCFTINPSSSKPISTCETQQSCLDIIRTSFDNGLKVEVCVLFDPSSSKSCIKHSADSISHICSSDDESDKMDGFEANIHQICKTVDCGSLALFGIKDGKGCSTSNGLSDITISGIDGISCSSDSYCGGGANKDCTWSIPAGNCPTLDPTSEPSTNPSAAPSDHPTSDPTSNPTSNPSAPPTSNPTREPTVNPTSHPSFNPTAQPTTQCISSPSKEYMVTPQFFTWSEAKVWCERQGMQLATFCDGDDIRDLYDICVESGAFFCWLGFGDFDGDGQFQFVDDGEVVDAEADGYWNEGTSGAIPAGPCGIITGIEAVFPITDSLSGSDCSKSNYGICETIEGSVSRAQKNDDGIMHNDDGLKVNDNNQDHKDLDINIIIIIIGGCILFGLSIIAVISFGVYKAINRKSNGKASSPQQQQQQQQQQQPTLNETEIELPPSSPSSVTNVVQ